MGSYFTYGVFSNQQDFSKAFSELSNKGFQDITVVKDTSSPLYKSATVHNSVKRTFIWGGLAGAIIGGIAGAVASPTVPYAGTFQILTPMMAMVSGAIVLAYFGVWICGFLSWLDKPIPADAFEGTLSNGILLLAVETEKQDLQRLAMECFSTSGAVEIIARTEALASMPAASTESVEQTKTASLQLAA
jgi:hypothetical protein